MLTQNRINHIIAVANLMKEKAPLLGLDPDQMFVLGYLHDVGYAVQTDKLHSYFGGEILKKAGYKYHQEVCNHGNPYTEYTSSALDLLNYCDMHINSNGELVSYEERLEDIKARRGEDSIEYKNSLLIVKQLIEKHFLD